MPAISPSFIALPAPHIAARFPAGVAAFEAQGPFTRDVLFDIERSSVTHAVESRMHEFVGGRMCARAALAQLGLPPVSIPSGPDRAPVWPQGFVGSISHSKGYCVAVAARVNDMDQGRSIAALGVDVEQVGEVLPELWPQLMREEEITGLQSLDANARAVRASLIFSAKEAFYKAQYSLTGEWVDFDDAAIEILENSFVLHIRNVDLPIARHSLSFKGRFLVCPRHVVTALAI